MHKQQNRLSRLYLYVFVYMYTLIYIHTYTYVTIRIKEKGYQLGRRGRHWEGLRKGSWGGEGRKGSGQSDVILFQLNAY